MVREAVIRSHRHDGVRDRPKPRDGPCSKEHLWLAGLDATPDEQEPVLQGRRPPPTAGVGTEASADGKDSYTGAFRNGRKHGKGTMRWSDGREYIGSWKDGHRNGKGTMTNRGCLMYEGQWRDGQPSGLGTMVSADGGQYRGEMQQGRRNGAGLFTTRDGSVTYEGSWRLGRCHGQGTLMFESGVTLEAEWREGRLDGEAVLTRPSQEDERVQTSVRIPLTLQAASTVREAKRQVAENFGIDSTRLRVVDEKTRKEMKDTVTMRMARLQDDDSLGISPRTPVAFSIEIPAKIEWNLPLICSVFLIVGKPGVVAKVP